jgi:cytochrome c oxidase subunit 1
MAVAVRPVHERVGRGFLIAGAAFFAAGIALSLVLRWQLAFPERGLSASRHAQAFTLHGLVMIFWALGPALLGGLGHALLPRLVGASGLAYPRLARPALAGTVVSGLLLLAAAAWDPAGAAGGWTFYPPLSGPSGSPGPGQTLALLALLGVVASTFLGALNAVVTVLGLRTRAWSELPLTAWGLFLAGALHVIFLPVLAAAAGLLLSDRLAGTAFFAAGGLGDPLTWQHLFWIFGHPQVYVLVLPAWGIMGDTFAKAAGRARAAGRAQPAALVAIAALSGLVHGHHLFTSGLGALPSAAFMALTLAISVPATILVASWIAELATGAVRASAALAAALGALVVFGLGGLSGTLLGSTSADAWLHDSLYVVGHFHLTLAGTSVLALVAALHEWWPALFGRRLGARLGIAHAAATALLLIAVFGGLLAAGWSGQPRRLTDRRTLEVTRPLGPLNQATSALALLLATSQVLFVIAVVRAQRDDTI